jgi:hypothetical protein
VIFFTRDLYLGYQPKSGWERRAENEWYRRSEIYHRYREVIWPLLPASVRRLSSASLHDGVVRKATIEKDCLELVIDATNALSGFCGRQVQLTFRGIKNRPRVTKLSGQWWLYEELHLSPRARFNLQVLFDSNELEIEADEMVIRLSKKSRR